MIINKNNRTATKLFIAFLFFSFSLHAQPKIITKADWERTQIANYLTKKHNYISIPITKMESGHLHVVAIINGAVGDFILDTGAGATVIETSKKEKFKLQTEETNNSGAGGTQSLMKATNNSFKIGLIEKKYFDLYVMNLDHVNTALKTMGLQEVDGVIGADILTENRAIIDYANLVLYLKK